MNIAVRTTSIMSSAMLSVPSVTRQPARSSSSMRAASPRRAAMAELMATAAPEAPSVASSSAVMQRQWGDQARGQQAAARDVLDRRDDALLANGGDLAP